MSGNLRLEYPHPEHRPGYEWGRHALDTGLDAAKARALDLLLNRGASGGFLNAVAVAPTSPASLVVEVAALEGYDKLAQHLRRVTTTSVNCAAAYDGTATVPTSGNRWIAIFCLFKWLEANPQEYEGTIYYEDRTEDVEFRVYKGTASLPPSSPGSGAVRVCDILLTEGITQILAGNIYTGSGHQDRISPAILGTGGTMTGPLYGPDGGAMLESNSGIFHWAYGSPIIIPAGGAIFIPSWLAGYYYQALKIHHGMAFENVLLDLQVNVPTLYAVSYIHPIMLYRPDKPAPQLLYTVNDHDGGTPRAYSGNTWLFIVGSEEWVESWANKWWRWIAYRNPWLDQIG